MSGYWEELKKRGYAAIDELPGTAESLILEFKQKVSPEGLGLADNDRRGIAEVLSGMSNAVGGVLLFGITCKKEDDIDVADGAQDIRDVVALAGRLQALCGEVLSPVNNDVEVLPLTRPGADTGIVAVRIGESDNRPHMSMAKGHQKYFQRRVGANPPMYDYQIRDMLRVSTTPKLELSYRYETHLGYSGNEYLSITLLVTNTGRASAKHACLLIRAPMSAHMITAVDASFRTFEHADRELRSFRSEPDQIIHPGMVVPAVRFLALFRRERPDSDVEITFQSTNFVKALNAELRASVAVGCEDCPLSEYALTLDGAELENASDLAVSGQRHALNALGARRLKSIQ